jgi:tetratricopeptide (TPR) repeat protein
VAVNRNQRSSRHQRGFGHPAARENGNDESHNQWQLYQRQVLPLKRLGRLKDAEPILNLLLQSRTRVPEVYRDLAELADARDDSELAEHWRDLWLTQNSNRAEQRWEQACAAESLGRSDQALQHLQELLRLQPRHLGGLQHQARLILRAGNIREAIGLFERWLAEAPADQEPRVCLAACLIEQHRFDAAEALLPAAKAPAWQQLSQAVQARLLQKQGNELEALELTKQLLHEADTGSCHWMLPRTLAPVLLEQQQLGLLLPVLEQAIQEQPRSSELRALEAECLLLAGQFQAGYAAWDLQHQLQQSHRRSHGSRLPRWKPEAHAGTLALIASGTLGDTLLLSRYAPWLQERLQTPVKLYVQPPLRRLLQESLGVNVGVGTFAELAQQETGSALPLMSLPGLFGSSQEHPELRVPHLRANPTLIEHWREQLQLQEGETLIGLNWHGSALQALSERHSSDIPLETFKTLSQLPGVRLLSLQKGIGQEQLEECSFRQQFVDIQEDVDREQRLEHVAALMSLCRCVVTDDSGPAHLAGCLGVDGVVLLPERINWRWGSKDPHRIAWYPSLRLLRQGSQQQWPELVAEGTQWLSDQLNHPLCDETASGGTAFG